MGNDFEPQHNSNTGTTQNRPLKPKLDRQVEDDYADYYWGDERPVEKRWKK